MHQVIVTGVIIIIEIFKRSYPMMLVGKKLNLNILIVLK